MKKFTSLLVLLLILGAYSLNSQFVRKVLVEEGTNASCGPCASQNPTFQKWINNHLDRVIPVIYHAWWPGPNDPMYKYDTIMNQTRIKYYNISGVPSGRVNGKIAPPSGGYYAGAVADTVALNKQLSEEPFYSMLSIEIPDFTVNQNDGSGTVRINVTSLKPISNVYLRVAICEKHHYYANAGSNGEKDFYWIARGMLPNAVGTMISLNENQTKSYEFNFKVDPSFTDDLYAVAFIQNDVTKEILQANWTFDYPVKHPDYSLFIVTPNLASVGNTNDKFDLEAVIINNTANPTNFSITILTEENLPNDWELKYPEKTADITVEPNSKFNFGISLTIGTTPFAAMIKINIQTTNGNFSQTSSSWKVFHSGLSRLNILAGETQHSIQPLIKSKLPSGFMYEISENDFAVNSNKFTSLKTIVWNGSTTGDFTATSANIIYDAMSKNQNILICGGKITQGMLSNGVLPYFGITFIAYCREGYGQAPYPVTLAGVPGDPITGDFGNRVQGYLINYLLPLFKIVNPNTTTPIMTFAKSADSICAVKVQWNKSRAIILGMNPYVIYDEVLRKNLISRSLQWLEGEISEVIFNSDNDSEIKFFPNPTSSISYLMFYLKKPIEHAKIDLIDIDGRLIHNIFEGTIVSIGEISIPVPIVGLPSQTYFVRVKLDEVEKFIPVVKVD